ncbi:MAG: ATP synthase F1 subunit epsilon [Cyclonatronaceae bacterium]
MIRTHIITPYGKIFEGQATGVNLPGSEGAFEVKKNHASLMAMLDIGKLIVRGENSKESYFTVNRGFVEVHNNEVTVLTEAAENVEDIDVNRAKRAKEEAQHELEEQKQNKAKAQELQKTELALKRAINRLKLADLK